MYVVHKRHQLVQISLNVCWPNTWFHHLDSWVVSHSAPNISTLRHALGCEFKPWWRQTLFGTQAQHLCFLHYIIWLIWFDTIICLSNLSCELWNRKMIINIFFKKMNGFIKGRYKWLCSISAPFIIFFIQFTVWSIAWVTSNRSTEIYSPL